MKQLTVDEFTHVITSAFDNFPVEYAQRRKLSRNDAAHARLSHGKMLLRVRSCRESLQELFHQSALWVHEQGYPLHKPVAAGIGDHALFYKINLQAGFRFEPDIVNRIDHTLMLPALKKNFNSRQILTLETVPLAKTARIGEKQLVLMEKLVENSGDVEWSDNPQAANLGYHNSRLIVTDPGPLIWRTDHLLKTRPI